METTQSFQERSIAVYQAHHQRLYPLAVAREEHLSQNGSWLNVNNRKSFMKYASSLIEIGTEEEVGDFMEVFEESELINPPESLILRYESMKNVTDQNGSKQAKYPVTKNIQNALLRFVSLLDQLLRKMDRNKTLNESESLIDVLAFSSVKNITSKDQLKALQQGFLHLKFWFYQSRVRQNMTRPILPVDRRKQHLLVKKNVLRVGEPVMILSIGNKKQGVEHIVGSLTFKVLQIQSESFKLIKITAEKVLVQLFVKKVNKMVISVSLKKIQSHANTQNTIKYDSKILTLSLSKSKGSFSKLKSHDFNSNKQKKLSIRKSNSNQNTDFSTCGEENFNERFINSDILEDFDFTKLQSKVGDGESQLRTEKKMEFKSKLKKKSIRESSSQAETMNSLRSLQSEEYHFGGTGQSWKVTSDSFHLKSPKKLDSVNDANEQDQIPTTKMIRYGVKNKKQFKQYENALINQAKQVQLFRTNERRYLSVRTNLFELPLIGEERAEKKKLVRKQQMGRIYHMKPDTLVGQDVLIDDSDNFLVNIIGSTQAMVGGFEKINNKGQKTIPTRMQLQRKSIAMKQQHEMFEKYYFHSPNSHSQKYITMHQGQATSMQQQELGKKSPKLKSKKLGKDNFEQYYFKEEIQKVKSTGVKNYGYKNIDDLKSMNKNFPNVVDMQIVNSPQKLRRINQKESYETEYRTSKILPGGNVIKNVKSLSPRIKLPLNSPYQGTKLPTRAINGNENTSSFSGKSQNVSKLSVQKHLIGRNGNLPVECQTSSINTPKEIHYFVPDQVPRSDSRSKSKLKVFSQTVREIAPNQKDAVLGVQVQENNNRKVSFVTSTAIRQQQINRLPSNTIHFPQQGSAFVPTVSNLSNDSKFSNKKNNITRVINYGPSVGYSQEFVNRPSSILSIHSNNQSKEKIIVVGPSQMMLSPTQRTMHGVQGFQIGQKKSFSPRVQTRSSHTNVLLANNNKQGLNVMMGGSPTLGSKMNSIKPKNMSSQKVIITSRK